MGTVTVLPLAPSLRDRLAVIVGSLDFGPKGGTWPDPRHCGECRQARADIGALNGSVADALVAVRESPTEAVALKAYFDFFAALAGPGVEIELMAADCGTTPGGDAGTEDGMKNAAGVTA